MDTLHTLHEVQKTTKTHPANFNQIMCEYSYFTYKEYTVTNTHTHTHTHE